MKPYWIQILFLLYAATGWTQGSTSWSVTPQPNAVAYHTGTFSMAQGISISISDVSLRPIVTFLESRFKALGINKSETAPNSILLEYASNPALGREGYRLDIAPERIVLSANEKQGFFYGLITLYQQVLITKTLKIPCGTLIDVPRFSYRGFMLDESRHFFGKEKVKQLLDMMALFKLNTFHWHLTDSNGWRIDITAYPKLGPIGGIGDVSDPEAPAQYYTQADISEVVHYAQERFIEIIPEIDMPGHATAANRAYPEYSGGGSPKYPDFTFNPGSEATYIYLERILEEVATVFPSKYIHLGGDEVHFGNAKWQELEAVQSLMQREELSTLKEVEHFFMEQMQKVLANKSKQLAGWDEIAEANIPISTTRVYWWRHDKPGQLNKSLAKGFKTVLCPRLPLYFDFVQDNRDSVGRRWDGFSSLDEVYAYPDSIHEFSEVHWQLIEGIQANLWTEVIQSEKRLDYMTYPRLFALSEAAWTTAVQKNRDRFYQKLPNIFQFLEDLDIYYFNTLSPNKTPEPLH
ncbi:MAG: Beta-hexosaminidase [Bacteroidota bacterium]|jgi:hexosaminidase